MAWGAHPEEKRNIEGTDASKAAHHQVRRLPDPAICRARNVNLTGFSLCLVEHPATCEHAVSYGREYYCKHPDRRRFERPSDKPPRIGRIN